MELHGSEGVRDFLALQLITQILLPPTHITFHKYGSKGVRDFLALQLIKLAKQSSSPM
jgi:hypothetical protein